MVCFFGLLIYGFTFGLVMCFFFVYLYVGFPPVWLRGDFFLVCLCVGFPLVVWCFLFGLLICGFPSGLVMWCFFFFVCLYVGFHLI